MPDSLKCLAKSLYVIGTLSCNILGFVKVYINNFHFQRKSYIIFYTLKFVTHAVFWMTWWYFLLDVPWDFFFVAQTMYYQDIFRLKILVLSSLISSLSQYCWTSIFICCISNAWRFRHLNVQVSMPNPEVKCWILIW